jgi:hypothetical protein
MPSRDKTQKRTLLLIGIATAAVITIGTYYFMTASGTPYSSVAPATQDIAPPQPPVTYPHTENGGTY